MLYPIIDLSCLVVCYVLKGNICVRHLTLLFVSKADGNSGLKVVWGSCLVESSLRCSVGFGPFDPHPCQPIFAHTSPIDFTHIDPECLPLHILIQALPPYVIAYQYLRPVNGKLHVLRLVWNANYLCLFFSETNRLDTGLIVELWNKGMLWDKLIGTHWLPLLGVKHSNQASFIWMYLSREQ